MNRNLPIAHNKYQPADGHHFAHCRNPSTHPSGPKATGRAVTATVRGTPSAKNKTKTRRRAKNPFQHRGPQAARATPVPRASSSPASPGTTAAAASSHRKVMEADQPSSYCFTELLPLRQVSTFAEESSVAARQRAPSVTADFQMEAAYFSESNTDA